MFNNKITTYSFSIDDATAEAIEAVAVGMNVNRSEALRQIVKMWKESNPVLPHPDGAQEVPMIEVRP